MLFLIQGAKYTGKTTIAQLIKKQYDAIPLQIDTTDSVSEELYTQITHNYVTPEEFNKKLKNDEYFIYKSYVGSLKKDIIYYGLNKTDIKPDKNYFAVVTYSDALNFISYYKDVTPIYLIHVDESEEFEIREVSNDLQIKYDPIMKYYGSYSSEYTHCFRRDIIASLYNTKYRGNEEQILASLNEPARIEAEEALKFERQYAKESGKEFVPHIDFFNNTKFIRDMHEDKQYLKNIESSAIKRKLDSLIKQNSVRYKVLEYEDFLPSNRPTGLSRFYNTGWNFGIVTFDDRLSNLSSLQSYDNWIKLGPITNFDENEFEMLFNDLAYKDIKAAILEETPKFTDKLPPIPDIQTSDEIYNKFFEEASEIIEVKKEESLTKNEGEIIMSDQEFKENWNKPNCPEVLEAAESKEERIKNAIKSVHVEMPLVWKIQFALEEKNLDGYVTTDDITKIVKNYVYDGGNVDDIEAMQEYCVKAVENGKEKGVYSTLEDLLSK